MQTTSIRMSAISAQAVLIAAGLPATIRFAESYTALDFGPLPMGDGRFEVRSYEAGASAQFIVTNGNDNLLVDFHGEWEAAFPNGFTVNVPEPITADMQPDAHGRRFVFGNWSLAASGLRFRPDEYEQKCAIRTVVMIELAKAIYPIACKV